jgi:NitT/TauT family transport system permease protein
MLSPAETERDTVQAPAETRTPQDLPRKEDVPWIDRIPRSVGLIGFGVAIVAIWQAVYALELFSKIIMPGPADTAKQLVEYVGLIVTGGHLWEDFWITTQESVLGFLAAAVGGILIGLFIGETRFGQRVVMPYLVAFNTMPKVAFAPVFVAWFGFGMQPKILLAAFVASFPVIVDTAAGMAAVDQRSQMLFRSMRAGRWKTIVKLKFPSALPSIFAGLKTASVFAVVGVVIGEYLGGGGGMGEAIKLASAQLRMAQVFALIFILSGLGLLLYGFVVWLEHRIVFWRRTSGPAKSP